MSTTSPSDSKENVGLAFALVFAAGLATALGACVVFVPRWVAYAQQSTLAAGLGLSAGVMVYVSFVEIFQKSRNAFVLAGYEEALAYAYATLCFFGGVALMELLNLFVAYFLHRRPSQSPSPVAASTSPQTVPHSGVGEQLTTGGCCAKNVHEWDVLQQMAATLARDDGERGQSYCNEIENENSDSLPAEDPPLYECSHDEEEQGDSTPCQSNHPKEEEAEDRQMLLRMSLNTAVAIGLHNFPEGLATFVGTLQDPAVGAVLAVAIAIHNIPEGLCVALPIYYATGSRSKAFIGALLSGLSEPLAAVLGYIVLAQAVSHVTYAILFGIVAGMMVMISTRELLPTAHRYDPDDRVVTYAFIVGMIIMAVSLVLFVI